MVEFDKAKLFGNLDFNEIETKGFNEEEVRAVIVDPMLKELGFNHENIMRNKPLKSPFLKSGSKRRPVNLIPDYAMKVKNGFAWILDAKASNQKIINSDNVEQVYSYATHPEIRSNYFALCNGLEFACFRTTDTEEPVLYFRLCEIEKHWQVLRNLLSPDSFQTGKSIDYEKPATFEVKVDFDYAKRPLLAEIPVKKQSAKRHFGVHGYFTRQAWNVVAEYIKNFSKAGDVVLDPFGGSGVTAIEALVNKRKAINIDLNPMAVFIVKSLLAPVKFSEFAEAYNKVCEEYKKEEPKSKKEVKEILANYPLPKKLVLPKGSDVEFVTELFSEEQMARLALLKSIIKKVKDKNIRDSLLLMFSGLITKINLTYHQSSDRSEGRGNASVFQYYRYRLAPKPVFVDIIKYFDSRYKKVRDAKKEIEERCLLNRSSVVEMMSDAQVVKGTATDLNLLQKESVDYIYTDPPYGKKIPYLDLSVMWNAWLDLKVSESDYKMEAIEGGEHDKTKEEYNSLIAKSIQEMYRVLKFDRWLSFVFAHKDPEFWHLIIETCEKCGFEYVGAVAQKNGQTSFKKRQNPFTVLSGELIINFRKSRNPRAVLKANLGMDIGEIVLQTIEGIIAKQDGATLEQINDELIIKGLELGFLDLLKKEYTDLTPILLDRFSYDPKTEKYNIMANAKFQTHVDIHLRIRYYIISYLRRMERENKKPTFDEIVLYIMPLLKNGITPGEQTVESVLKDIGERIGTDSWRLKKERLGLFDGV
jgi:DNA modification methylase